MEIEIKDFYSAGCELVAKKVDAEEFWSNTFGSGWEECSWWIDWKYSEGADWNKIGEISLTVLDPEDYNEVKTITKTIGLEDIIKAYEWAQGENAFHCGGRWRWDDQDVCVSDGILQIAVFGELTYA
jgi:hypothetical protein